MAQPQTSSQAAPDFIPAVTPDFIPATAAKKEQPGFLDREIPLDSYKNATLSGVQSIGRGIRSAGRGLYDTVRHPIDTAEGMIDAVTDAPSQIEQIPGAIRDINHSRDPLGTYLKVGQETAGEGAGQALSAIATEKLGEAAKKAAPPAVRGAAKGINKVLEKAPGSIGAGVGAGIGHATGIPGATEVGGAIGYGVGREVLPKVRIPGEHFGFPDRVIGGPKTAPQYSPPPAFRDPGAPLPEVSDRALLQSRHLAEGPRPIEEPAAGLGTIPVAQKPPAPVSIRRGPGEIPAEAATASAPEARPEVSPAVARPSATTSSRLDELLNDAVGGRELEPNTPLRQQLSRIGKPSVPTPKMRPISDLSQQIKDSAPASDAPKMAPLTNLSQQIKNSAVALPEGFTPVESEVLRGYKYNPEAREFEAVTNNGQHYVHSDVSPEEAAKFESSDSKGTAWNQLRKGPGITLTKKGPVGQLRPVKPGTLKTNEGVIAKSGAGMKPDAQPISDDLSDEWQRNNEFLKKTKRASRIAKVGD